MVCRQVVVVVAVAVVVDVIAVVNAAIVVVDFLTGSRANRAGHKNRRKAQCDATPITIHKMQHSNVSTKVTKGGNWVVKILYISKISICSESFFFWQCSCCPCCCCCGPVCTGLQRVTAGFDCLSRRYKMINFNAAAAARDLSPQLGLGGSLIKSNSRGTSATRTGSFPVSIMAKNCVVSGSPSLSSAESSLRCT